jgi:proteasome accessory factor C
MSRATASERVERILSVLPWIVESPGATVGQVCERFDLTERDLRADLDLLMYDVGIHPFTPDARVDVLFEGDRIFISLGDYFRRPLRLTHDEALALYAAGRAVLDRPAPDPTLGRAVDKLGAVLGAGVADAVDVRLGDADPVILETVESATRDGRRLAIDYYSFGRDERSRREVDPQRVVADGGHWYLLGWCHTAGGPRSFRVDRIADARILDEPVAPHPVDQMADLDLSDAGRTVELVIGPGDAWVADTYPTESVEVLDDGRLRIVLQVTATPWLERLLLRLGPDATAVDGDGGASLGPLAAAAATRVLARYGG